MRGKIQTLCFLPWQATRCFPSLNLTSWSPLLTTLTCQRVQPASLPRRRPKHKALKERVYHEKCRNQTGSCLHGCSLHVFLMFFSLKSRLLKAGLSFISFSCLSCLSPSCFCLMVFYPHVFHGLPSSCHVFLTSFFMFSAGVETTNAPPGASQPSRSQALSRNFNVPFRAAALAARKPSAPWSRETGLGATPKAEFWEPLQCKHLNKPNPEFTPYVYYIVVCAYINIYLLVYIPACL